MGGGITIEMDVREFMLEKKKRKLESSLPNFLHMLA